MGKFVFCIIFYILEGCLSYNSLCNYDSDAAGDTGAFMFCLFLWPAISIGIILYALFHLSQLIGKCIIKFGSAIDKLIMKIWRLFYV